MFVVQNLFFLNHEHSTPVHAALQNLSCLCSYMHKHTHTHTHESHGFQKKCLAFDSLCTENHPNLTLVLVTFSAFWIAGID